MSVDVAPSRTRRLTPAQRWGAVALSTLAVLLIDRLSKSWALDRLDGGRIVDVVGSLRFNLAFNTGMAFSKGSGAGPIIGLIAVVIAVVLLIVARRVSSMLQLVLIGVVIGGALGNVIDRLIRVGEIGSTGSGFMSGAVVDFIDLQWWPVFNVADAAICIGGIGLALTGLRAPDDENEPGAEIAADADGDPVDGEPLSDGPVTDEPVSAEPALRGSDSDEPAVETVPTDADAADGPRTDG